MASMWPSTVVRFAPIVTTDMWLPPALRHAAISPGHWLSPRLYCWMDSKPNASASLPPGPKFDYKLRWFNRFAKNAESLLATGEPVVLVGDYNVAGEMGR